MKSLLISLFVFISLSIFSQEEAFQWQNCYGGTEYEDAGNYEDAIVKVPGGYLVLAETDSDDGDIQSGLHGPRDIWLIKIDLFGNLIWEKTIGGSSGAGGYTLTKYNDTTFYIFGVTASIDGDVQSGNQGLADNWIIKFNENGDVLWEKTYGGNKNDKYGSLQLTPEGDILVLSETWSQTGDFGTHSLLGDLHLWFYKINPSGEILWSELYGGTGRSRYGDFLQTNDEGYLLVGTCNGLDGTGCECEHHNPGDDAADVWVIKLDSTRKIEWQNCYGGGRSDQCLNILEEDFGYTLLGHSQSSDGQVGLHHGNSVTTDLWFFKIDKQGYLVHSKVLGGGDSDHPDAIFKNEQTGGYTIFAHTESNNFDVSGNHSFDYESDIWYVEIDSLGEILFQNCIGNQGSQQPGGILELDDGNFIVSATSNWSEADDVECPRPYPYSKDDIWFFELLDCQQNPLSIPSQPLGADTVCNNGSYVYTTQFENPQYEDAEWYLEPMEAGELTNMQDSVIIHWNTDFEGQVSLSVRSTNSCGESAYSEPKIIKVRSCVGIGEIQQRQLKFYPNPANSQITIELPKINKKSFLQIKDIFGKTVTQISLLKGQTQFIWECSHVPSGVYFYQMEIEGLNYSGKILIK